ncbi:MAG TPA: N-6 DNA methylase [Thermoanaerobaculia bacterium]|nr:N-6 DNA methylase [Thermoanaerobaculia bacterium]
MLTAAALRQYTGEEGALDLLRALGYPVVPVDVDAHEWRRGGVSIPWNGEGRLRLISRLRRFDLFMLHGNVREEWIAEFMRSYGDYNIVTKSALIYCADQSLSVFDLSRDRALRRLDVDLANPTTHAVDRLNLLARPVDLATDDSLPRIFDRALDREQVTREFFQRFRAAVQDVAAELAKEFPDEGQAAADGQALLILSRLLFLSFVQEKGWLGGERRFLIDRLEHEIRRGRELFSGVLMPLFFGCLNTPLHERSLAARKLGRVPYLNGGLFEPSPFEQRHPEIHLPNALLQRVLEEVFERFDFRLNEINVETDAAGTHIDPEMLGRVFESLMAGDERAASGSFYTPKEVVDVLAERAIAEWLGDGGVEKLERIAVLDPACGSGAFLLSALGVIERLWRARTSDVPRDLRRRIVANSLYGVDLKPEAVRLCELRLWLAIVSGSDATVDDVEPLPNLDRNILQGNSLLSPTDFLGDARMDIYVDWVAALHAQRDLLERYRAAPFSQRPALYRVIRGNDQRLASELLARTIDVSEAELVRESAPQKDLFGRAAPVDEERCRELQQRIADAQRMLDRVEQGTLDFFSFDVHFAPVLAHGGFDVVVGNPPWVRNARIDPRAKKMLAERYALFRPHRDGAAFHQPDLSVAFFERALQLASPEGAVALLMPAKILNAAYAAPLRRLASGHVIAVHDWSDDPRRRKWFEADTFPLGIVLRSRRADESTSRPEPSGQLLVDPTARRLDDRLTPIGAEWSILPRDVAEILQRLRATHRPLAEVLHRKPFMGVKTGDNRSFFLDEKTIRRLRIPFDALCRCVRGRDLRRWSVGESQWMLWPPRGGWRNPPRWLEKLADARRMSPADFRLSFVRPEHVGVKVAWKDLSRGLCAAVLPDVVHVHDRPVPLIPNQTLYAIDAVSLDEAYLIAAILNSTIAGALLVSVAERAKDAHFRYFGRTVAALPWPEVREEREWLVRFARRAHRGLDVAKQLDAVVAHLYGVSPEELLILRRYLDRRLDARRASD